MTTGFNSLNGFFTLKQFSIISGIPERSLHYRIKLGQLEAVKLGWLWLIPENQLEIAKSLNRKGVNKT